MNKRGIYKLALTTKMVAEDAFCCSCLDEVVLNDGLESIGRYAFSDNNIRHWIFIPKSVIHIDKEAFVGEWSSQSIVVVKDSYAHYYAKKNRVQYRCKPQHGEVTWNEHEWITMFGRAKFREDYEMIRSWRQGVFQSTLQAVKKGEYMTAHGHIIKLPLNHEIQNRSKFYFKETHPKPHYSTRYNTQIAAVNDDCLSFARRVHDVEDEVCVLNMASRRNPGGGVLSGAGAQEEYLFRCSDYFRSLYQYAPYASDYDIEKSTFSYPLDRNFGGCFSPGVTVFRGTEEEGYRFLHHPRHINFIAVAGMNNPELTMVNDEERIVDNLIIGIKKQD
ncbi:MAG: TIGR02452 family protein [Bacteroidales bacterium]|nr:TIGR02452 family protein [Bacteroidales bacterium]